MARVKVTGYYEPEPDEQDSNDRTGLTEAAYEELVDALSEVGVTEVTVIGMPD